ncbi:unnamed protein product [Heterobilharzia americana]|nr:unnamed protein product [Heterobilharzia americana]
MKPRKDDERNLITKEEKQRKRWVDHFKKLLNRPPPALRPEIPPAAAEQQVNINPPTKVEVLSAIKLLKCGKAAGPDGIQPEALRTDAETTAAMLTPLLQKVWKEEKVPGDWKKGYLVKLPKKGDLSVCKNWRGITFLSTLSKQNIKLYHLGEAKECTGFKTTTGTGWQASGSTNYVRTKLQRITTHHHRTEYRMAVNPLPQLYRL